MTGRVAAAPPSAGRCSIDLRQDLIQQFRVLGKNRQDDLCPIGIGYGVQRIVYVDRTPRRAGVPVDSCGPHALESRKLPPVPRSTEVAARGRGQPKDGGPAVTTFDGTDRGKSFDLPIHWDDPHRGLLATPFVSLCQRHRLDTATLRHVHHERSVEIRKRRIGVLSLRHPDLCGRCPPAAPLGSEI